jgi:bacterial leucyl aminopeptidase
MTAWVKAGTREEVGVVTDYTDERHVSICSIISVALIYSFLSLTEFNKELVDQYLAIPWVETKCGYACSDQCVYIPVSP